MRSFAWFYVFFREKGVYIVKYILPIYFIITTCCLCSNVVVLLLVLLVVLLNAVLIQSSAKSFYLRLQAEHIRWHMLILWSLVLLYLVDLHLSFCPCKQQSPIIPLQIFLLLLVLVYACTITRNGYETVGKIKVDSIDRFKQLEVANKVEYITN